MRQIVRIVGVLVVLAGLAATSGSVQARDASGDVKSLDRNVYDAIAARDGARLAGMLDDGFMLTNTFGTVYDKQKFLTGCCAGDSSSKTLSLGATEMDVKTYGDSAVVFALTEMKFMKDNQNQSISWRSLRVYVRSAGKWKLVAESRTSL